MDILLFFIHPSHSILDLDLGDVPSRHNDQSDESLDHVDFDVASVAF